MKILNPTTPGGLAMLALTRRELVRFVRQPTRIAASVGTALIVWVLAGSGFAKSFQMPGAGDEPSSLAYAAFLLPGMAAMIVIFSAIFAAITLIQDRQAGFLQSALVSPAPTWSIVGAKVLGGTIVATLQAAILLLAAPLVGSGVRLGFGFPLALLAAALTSAAVISLGLACAWRINSIAGFHGVMNLLLLPMWVLSGSLFPVAGAAPWLREAVELNPLHWSVNCMGWALGVGGTFSLWQWGGVVAFAAAMFGLAWLSMRQRTIPPSSEGEA